MSITLARDLVMNYGWNSTCYQILNPGIAHWFSSLTPAVVGYVRRNRMLLVAGAPVCTSDRLADVCGEFEAFARRKGCGVCYVCAEERLRILFEHSPSHAAVTLGAQPIWRPPAWPDLIQRQASLRSQLNRCRNKAVSVEHLPPEHAVGHGGGRRILQEWLAARRLPPMHFLAEPDVLNEVNSERVILVAKRDGVPVAYLVACPIAARKGYLIELLARARTAPNGTSELLIDGAMRRFAGAGISRVTLGLVALAHAAESGIRGNPFWLRAAMQFARLHANRFYNFRGLEQFREKLAPCGWEPVYAISTENRFSPRTLYSLGAAFAGIPPWLAIGIGVAKAVREEICGSVSWQR
jgi:phosphatidylglycerol lysyltransferase